MSSVASSSRSSPLQVVKGHEKSCKVGNLSDLRNVANLLGRAHKLAKTTSNGLPKETKKRKKRKKNRWQ